MKEKQIVVIGVGGRTGTMFAFELCKRAKVVGIGEDIEDIKKGKLFVKKGKGAPEVFKEKVITPSQFPNEISPEIIFLTTKNPIRRVIKYYYQKIKEKNLPLPILVLSQNGIAASKDALLALREVLGPESKKVKIIRMSLFNPIDKKEINDQIQIVYSLPIRLGFGKVSGPGDLKEVAFLFEDAGFEAKEYPSGEVKNMEFSKLFLNLIGIASATRKMSLSQGFEDSEVFKEEVKVLKEYIKVIETSGGAFLNFSHQPVKFFTFLIKILPTSVFLPLRNYLSKIISKEREGKPKDLTEIEYYNGAVISLGEEAGVVTPINQRVLKRVI